MIEFIKSEKSKSKAKKRENGIQNLLPVDLRAKVKGFVPKDPTSPTKHRKNHCSNDKKKEDKLPLKKSANSKWNNNVINKNSQGQTKKNRDSKSVNDRHERSQSRKIKSIFYKDGFSHTDIQSSKFSPTFTHVG